MGLSFYSLWDSLRLKNINFKYGGDFLAFEGIDSSGQTMSSINGLNALIKRELTKRVPGGTELHCTSQNSTSTDCTTYGYSYRTVNYCNSYSNITFDDSIKSLAKLKQYVDSLPTCVSSNDVFECLCKSRLSCSCHTQTVCTCDSNCDSRHHIGGWCSCKRDHHYTTYDLTSVSCACDARCACMAVSTWQ